MELYSEKNVLKNELEYEGTVLLTYRIAYPVFLGSRYQMALAVVNKYYEQLDVNPEKIEYNGIGCVVGTHAGPGCYGMVYFVK